MEYIVSARKYRPLTFDSVVGQGALTETLKNSVRTGKLAHAYLFCGPRGVGKTTCARIFSKVINCTSPTPEGDACGQCESCKAFDEQRSFNIFELDAASNNGVDHIKTLMDQTRIPPQIGKYKVFIIDEVHMLSTQAFNAFLKTLEEPPSYVVFILATTEKHKLLPTIISRCQIYDFERMTVPNTINHLKMVAEKEGIKYEEDALNLIAEKADGGMRDALSIFDQVASYCQGDITREKVIQDLNILDSDTYFKIVDLSLENNVADIMTLVNDTLAKGFDGGHLANGLASHLRNVMLSKDEKTISLLLASDNQKERYKQQAQKCSPSFLYKALKLLNNCDVNYRQSSNKRLLVELTLIEVAQITQPEEPGSGRSPKMLKTIFKKILAALTPNKVAQTANQQATSVSQMPSVNSNVTPQPPQQQTVNQSPGGNSVQTAKIVDTSRVAAIHKQSIANPGSGGFTFAGMNETRKKIEEISSVDTVEEANETFTQENLETCWRGICGRMSHDMKALAMRLSNLQPQMQEFPIVELALGNKLIFDEISAIKKRLEVTLRKELNNSHITIKLRMLEQSEVKRLLTPREQFDELCQKFPAINKLFSSFSQVIVS